MDATEEKLVEVHETHDMGIDSVGVLACSKCWWCECHNVIILLQPCDDQATIVKRLVADIRQRKNAR